MALSEITAAKIDHGLAALALDQIRGDAPPEGMVSLSDIAARAGVSESTIAKLERIALAKVALRLSNDPSLPPHLCRRLSRILFPND